MYSHKVASVPTIGPSNKVCGHQTPTRVTEKVTCSKSSPNPVHQRTLPTKCRPTHVATMTAIVASPTEALSCRWMATLGVQGRHRMRWIDEERQAVRTKDQVTKRNNKKSDQPSKTAFKDKPSGKFYNTKITRSQLEFFRMLDEKIAQGKDCSSEDET